MLLLHKSTFGKDKTPFPPYYPALTKSTFVMPPFKSKSQAPGLLGGRLGLGGPIAGSGEAAQAPNRTRAGAWAVTWKRRAGRQVSLAARVPTRLTAARQGKWQI